MTNMPRPLTHSITETTDERLRGNAAKLFQQVVADPRGSLRDAGALLRARIDLARCSRLGLRPRLYGRCRVEGPEGIEIGDSFHMSGRTVRCEIATHQGGKLIFGDGVFINYGSSFSAHARVEIGNGCAIGQYAIILDCDFHMPGLIDQGHGTPQRQAKWLTVCAKVAMRMASPYGSASRLRTRGSRRFRNSGLACGFLPAKL